MAGLGAGGQHVGAGRNLGTEGSLLLGSAWRGMRMATLAEGHMCPDVVAPGPVLAYAPQVVGGLCPWLRRNPQERGGGWGKGRAY